MSKNTSTTLPASSAQATVGLAIGLDVGGTKIAGGVVAPDGQVLERAIVPTPSGTDQSTTLTAMTELINRLRTRHPSVALIGVGTAGLVEWPGGRIRFAPNNAFRNVELKVYLEQATGLPTVVDNDANVAALAEAHFGIEPGVRDLMLLTIGTGIGGGLVFGGQIFRGRTGLGAEVGHIIMEPDGPACGCGNRGCLEAMASGIALGRLGREAALANPEGRLACLAGGDPQRVNGEVVSRAAREGDQTARGLFAQIGFWLGVGIASLVTVLDPGLIVLAGGLASTGELLLKPTRASFEQYVFARAYRDLPQLALGRLGPDVGMIGAAVLALQEQSSSQRR